MMASHARYRLMTDLNFHVDSELDYRPSISLGPMDLLVYSRRGVTPVLLLPQNNESREGGDQLMSCPFEVETRPMLCPCHCLVLG